MQADIVNHLRETFNPDAIILHGSRARGRERANSDWDFILLFNGEPSTGTGRQLFKGQNLEYTTAVLPVADIYEEFGGKLQGAKVLYEKDGEGTALLNRAETTYAEGVHWSTVKLEGHKLWAIGRINGMKDSLDSPIIFDKYYRDFSGRVFNYWYWILQEKHSQPVYIAVDEVKEKDPEYFELVNSLITESNLLEKIKAAEAIYNKLFNNLK
jgi:hypothetical protein